MRKLARQIVLWSAFLLMPAAVQGQDFDFVDYTGPLGEQEYLNFVGGSGVASRWSDGGYGQVQVGPYVGSFSTSGVTSDRFSLLCVDFENFAGSQWVNVTSIGGDQDGSSLGVTRLAGAGDALARYRQAAYLGSLFESWRSFGTDQRTVWGGLHGAIWSIMTGGAIGTNHYASNELRQGFMDLAEIQVADGFAADGWYVLSGIPGEHQEMLIRTPTTTVPEPSTYLLMATGLAFLAILGRKRRLTDLA